MATKKPTPMQKPNRVWIELEKPRDKAHGDELAEKANRMLRRLMEPSQVNNCMRFSWSVQDRRYHLSDPSGCYTVLDSFGEWFNLDYMGRE